MRIKIISAVAVIAALAIGATASNATFRSEVAVKVKLAKAGAPAKLTMVIDNTDSANVPDRISSVVVTSKVAKFNSKAVPQCSTPVPSNAAGNNTGAALNPACPKGSKIGSGKFTANTGIEGQPIPFNDLGVINGAINVYNYKPGPGEQAALLFELMSDTPVPDTHQYMRAGVTKGGVVVANIPNVADLPPKVADLLRNPDMSFRTASMAHSEYTLTAPRPKKGQKPFFTLKNTKNMDFSVVLNRD